MKDGTVMTLRENGQLEAKRAKGGVPESIWETYSAFANTNGGLIILGAEEGPKGEVEYVGVPNPKQLVKKFWDGVHNPSKVSANILTDDSITIETINDCDIIRIQVPRANRHLRPIYICGNREKGTYRRDGEGDYRCSSEEIVAMIRDASNEPLDDTVLEEFPLDALSWDTVSRYRAVVSAARPNHPWLKLDDEGFLVKLNAIGRTNGEGEFHPTRAGLLMFGFEYEIAKEYANYFLDYREADQERRWADRITSQDGTWTGNLFDFWTEALPRLTSGLKKPFALDNNLQRIEDTEMHAAIREALANALVHSDYYGRRGIVALRYSDRIEIANPGNSRVALDVVRAGGISDARNPTLMRMFGLISACERMGSGFDVMSNAAKAASAPPPEIEELFNPDRVMVKVYTGKLSAFYLGTDAPSNSSPSETNHTPASSSSAQPSVPAPQLALSHDLAKIVEVAQEKGGFTRRDVESALNCGATKAKGLIAELLGMGIIASEGSARGTRYRLR